MDNDRSQHTKHESNTNHKTKHFMGEPMAGENKMNKIQQTLGFQIL